MSRQSFWEHLREKKQLTAPEFYDKLGWSRQHWFINKKITSVPRSDSLIRASKKLRMSIKAIEQEIVTWLKTD